MEDFMNYYFKKVKKDYDLQLNTLKKNNNEYKEYFQKAINDLSISNAEKEIVSVFAIQNATELKILKAKVEAFEKKYAKFLQ